MKILFMNLNMNLGGTEKSLLNLLSVVPEDITIDLLLLEKSGLLLDKIPSNVNILTLQNSAIINHFIKAGPRSFAFTELKKGNYFNAVKNLLVFLTNKLAINNNIYAGLNSYLDKRVDEYDYAIAYAGPHDFISFFILNYTTAKNKIQWIHFDIEKVMSSFNFGKKYYPFFDKIFCVSESARDIFVKHFPRIKDKTEVFHNIVSKEEIRKQAETGETFEDKFDGIRILSVGRFTKEKGQHLIPEVAKRLKLDNINFRWYLVGAGKEKSTVWQMTLDSGVDNHVIFLGEKTNPYRYMQDCDIYVQPSLHEGFGITVAEAKIFCRPIVVTDFASAENLIRNNETGIIAEINEESLYLNLKRLILQNELQKTFTNNLIEEHIQTDPVESLSKLLF